VAAPPSAARGRLGAALPPGSTRVLRRSSLPAFWGLGTPAAPPPPGARAPPAAPAAARGVSSSARAAAEVVLGRRRRAQAAAAGKAPPQRITFAPPLPPGPQLVNCTRLTCPLSSDVTRDADGAVRPVNRAPFFSHSVLMVGNPSSVSAATCHPKLASSA
jgi:hypothetical protein